MSQVDHNVDLDALARTEIDVEPPRRSWLRIVLPLAIIAAFSFVLSDSIAELLQSRIEVTVVRPMHLEGVDDGAAGTQDAARPRIVVQAAGWVEPDPFPTLVPALAGGVVDELLVQESDVVAAGDAVARIVDEDARLAVVEARAEVAARVAALELARVRTGIAAERYEAALDVHEAARVARARRAGSAAAAELHASAVAEGKARVGLAESEILVQRELEAAGAAGARQVEIAEAELEVAQARLATLRAEAARATAQVEEDAARDERARRDLELRFTDRLARDESASAVEAAAAELERARAALATSELRLARATVVAPRDGVVLERLATAGDTLAVGAPVCSLFDPSSLRVRVDVPQNDVAKVGVGLAAELLADARPGRPYRGEVIRLVQRADIQKVTLEAQVRVLDADAYLRPDMLTQVRFFSGRDAGVADRAEGSTARGPELRIAVPLRLVESGAVWVLDPTAGVARRSEVELGERRQTAAADGSAEEWVEVRAGLDLTDKIIDEGRGLLASKDRGDGVPVRVRRSDGFADAGGKGIQR